MNNDNFGSNSFQRKEKRGFCPLSIIKYVDYTKKYGLGYILSNGFTGIYFNDSTKILLHKNKTNIIYIDNEDRIECTLNKYPTSLKKKITLLKHFRDYLWKNDKKHKDFNQELEQLKNTLQYNNNNNDSTTMKELIFVKCTVSDQYCMLFKLSDNTVQVNFTDTSLIIIKQSNVLYRDKNGKKEVFKLEDVLSSSK